MLGLQGQHLLRFKFRDNTQAGCNVIITAVRTGYAKFILTSVTSNRRNNFDFVLS